MKGVVNLLYGPPGNDDQASGFSFWPRQLLQNPKKRVSSPPGVNPGDCPATRSNPT